MRAISFSKKDLLCIILLNAINEVVMRQCPKCESTRISKEKWHEAVPNAFEIGGDAALGQTGDLVCNDCGFASSPGCFQKKDAE